MLLIPSPYPLQRPPSVKHPASLDYQFPNQLSPLKITRTNMAGRTYSNEDRAEVSGLFIIPFLNWPLVLPTSHETKFYPHVQRKGR